MSLGYAAIFLVAITWAYQMGHQTNELFVYYTGPLIVLGVPLIFLDSIKPKMVSWWVTARDNSRPALGMRAMLNMYASTSMVAAFFVAIALVGIIAVGQINWLILSHLLLAATLATLLLCVTVQTLDRLQQSGMYLLYIVCALAVLTVVLFWLGSLLPAGPMATLVMAMLLVLAGALCARAGGNALARVELF